MPIPAWNLLLYAVAEGLEEEKELALTLKEMGTALTTDTCNVLVQINSLSVTTRHWISRANPSVEKLAKRADASTMEALRDFLDAGAKRPAAATALILLGHGSGLDATRGYSQILDETPAPPSPPPFPHGPPPHGPPFPHGPPHGPPFPPHVPFHPGSALPQGPTLPSKLVSSWTRRTPTPSWRKLRRMRGEPYRWGPAPGTSTYLTNPKLREAIERSGGKRVDVLALNACWMSVLEVESEMSAVASVQLASQVYATPWPYASIVKAISALAAPPSAEGLAQLIVTRVQAELDAGKREDSISAFRAGELAKLPSAVDAYAAALLPLVDSAWDHIVEVITGPRAQCPHYADLGAMAAQLGASDKDAKKAGDAVRAQLAAARIAQAAYVDFKWLQGLSIFLPDKKDMDLAAAYDGLAFKSNRWMKFLKKVQDKLPPDRP